MKKSIDEEKTELISVLMGGGLMMIILLIITVIAVISSKYKSADDKSKEIVFQELIYKTDSMEIYKQEKYALIETDLDTIYLPQQ